jgi:putative transposase
MPWEGVTVSEQRRNFIRDYVAGFYSRVELATAFSISRKTAYKWIGRFRQSGDERQVPRQPSTLRPDSYEPAAQRPAGLS